MKKIFEIKQIGVIKSPYEDIAPYQPVASDENEFVIVLDKEYKEGLQNLKKFEYIYVFYYMHKIKKNVEMVIKPPWAKGKKVGLFSSRSPVRPNPIGISVVKLKKIVENKIYTSGLDVFNNTPVIDIKPYIKDLDEKSNADYGWINELDDNEHFSLHLKGIPHTH